MRVTRGGRVKIIAAGVLGLLATITSLSLAGAQTRGPVLDAAIAALVSGDRERLLSLFRYFEGAVSPTEFAKGRRVVGVYFDLLKEHFGRSEPLETTQTTVSRFVNFYIESATPDLWRNSDCLFKAYAFRTAFVDGRGRHLLM